MASNLPPGYCDETHSWRGFAAGNAGEPPFPTRATAPRPAAGATGDAVIDLEVAIEARCDLHDAETLMESAANALTDAADKIDKVIDRIDFFEKGEEWAGIPDMIEEYYTHAVALRNQIIYLSEFPKNQEAKRKAERLAIFTRAALTTPPAAPEAGAAWVSVQDRLPEAAADYITHCRGSVLVLSWHYSEVECQYVFSYYTEDGWVKESGITHWQPLPAAPAPTCTGCGRSEPCGSQQERQEQQEGGVGA